MARKKIKRYKVSPDESLCLAVSVVDRPAVESDFMFFNEQRMEKFVGVEGERKMIYGCALRPDFPIYRNNGEEEYYLEFSKDAIDKISKNYFKMGFQSNWTAGHKDEVEGLAITESWIKEDMYKDKSVAIGLDADLPVGSWIIGCHCENDDIWKAVKEGKYHGFSIEAIVGIEEFEKQVELNSNNMNIETNDMGFWNKMKSILTEVFTSTSLAKQEEVDTEESEASKVEHLEEQAPMVEEPTVVETPTEPQEPIVEPKVEEVKEEVKEEPKEAGNESKPNPLEELVKSLTDEVKALKEMNEGLQTKIKDLGKQPSANPVNTNAKPSKADTYSAWRETMRNYLS